MNPEKYGPATIPRLIAGLEIFFGLLVPAFVVGPLLVFGLIFGIVSPLSFVISACGAWGLVGIAMSHRAKEDRLGHGFILEYAVGGELGLLRGSGQGDQLPPLPRFLRETSEMLELYLI